MSLNGRSKIAKFIIGFFVAIMLIGFIFSSGSSLNAPRGGTSTVAQVGNSSVSIKEFQRQYTSMLNYYSQLFGGQNLTPQQIKQFNIKGMVLDTLVQQKLFVNLGQELKLEPSKQEVAEEIRKIPNFQKNNKFDVSMYKLLLNSNGFTPLEFEESVREDITAKNVSALLRTVPVSQGYLHDFTQMKKSGITVDAVSINHDDLKNLISVSSAEIDKVVADPSKDKILENLYQRNFDKYNHMGEDKKAAVNKTFAQVERELAEMYLKDQKTDDLKNLITTKTQAVEKMLATQPATTIEKEKKNFGATVYANKLVDFTSMSLPGVSLKPSQVTELFKLQPGEVKRFDLMNQTVIIKVAKKDMFNGAALKEEESKTIKNQLDTLTGQYLSKKILEKLKQSYKTVYSTSLLENF